MFVAGALPGDRVVPETVERHRGFLRATRWRLLAPGPDRVDPPCVVADDCGGCDLMRLARPAQLRVKGEILADAMRRTGKLPDQEPIPPVVTAGDPFGYRHRARLHLAGDKTVGFFGRRSHDLVALERCPVCTPLVNAGIEALCRAPPGSLAALESIELRAAPAGEPLVACGRAHPGAEASGLRALERTFAGLGAAWVLGASQGPVPEQRFPLPSGAELRLGPTTFSQVNWAMNERMVADVVETAIGLRLATFADLYAGAGNFSLPLLSAGLDGVAVERSSEAVALARASAAAARLDASRFQVGSAEAFAQAMVSRRERTDLVLLDPPRAGARPLLRTVARLRPRLVGLVACDPVSLARDLRTLLELGFCLRGITAYDLFPQTHHVEAVAWLDGTGSSRRMIR